MVAREVSNSIPISGREIEVRARWGEEVGIGGVSSDKPDLQLMLHLRVLLPNGRRQVMDMLVDTGAEASLIRKGLVSSELFSEAEQKLCLVTASGQRLPGGDRIVNLGMEFYQLVGGRELEEVARLEGEFYEADIKVDAIISFPWLLHNRIGIFPHLGALAKDEPQFTLLYGDPKGEVRRKKKRKGKRGKAEVMELRATVVDASEESGKA